MTRSASRWGGGRRAAAARWAAALGVVAAGALVMPTACAARSSPGAPAPPGAAAPALDAAPRAYPDCLLHVIARRMAWVRQRDRATAPRPADVDPSVTLAALLAPGEDAGRFDDRRAAEIEAWVVDVKVGGIEPVNCLTLGAWGRDTHVDLAAYPGAPDTARVVAEVTPRWRAAMREAGVDWSTAGLRAALVGRRVRVRGWLYYDERHAAGSARHDPGDRRGERNWRATAWELHPVTAMALLP